jgi:hypothetical protein
MQTSPEVNFRKREIQRKKLSPITDMKCDQEKMNFFYLILFGVVYLIHIVKQEKQKQRAHFWY